MSEAPPLRPVEVRHCLELAERLGPSALLRDGELTERYGRDETESLWFRPGLVVLPSSVQEVERTLAYAHAERIAVVPRGAGTGLSGGALPVVGGIVLSLERMNRIREIDERDLVAVAEAGVVTADLQNAVEARGLFYPPDPSSRESCQVGGNLAEDSAGPRSVKYGTTRRWVLGVEAAAGVRSERWLPWAGIPPTSLSIRARCIRFHVMKVVLRLVKSFSGPRSPRPRDALRRRLLAALDLRGSGRA